MLKMFARLIDGVSSLAMWTAMFIALLMMFHIAADVFARNFLGGSLFGTIEIVSGYYMVALMFLPLAWIVGREGHIYVELFTRHMSPRGLLKLDTFVLLISIAYVGVLAWQSILNAYEQTLRQERWETALGFVPMWPSRWFLVAGFVCFFLQLIAFFLMGVARIMGEDKTTADTE